MDKTDEQVAHEAAHDQEIAAVIEDAYVIATYFNTLRAEKVPESVAQGLTHQYMAMMTGQSVEICKEQDHE